MTLALCAVIAAPPAWRAVVALCACGATISVAFATLALIWHYPSDVLAGLLLGGLWVAAALTATGGRPARAPLLRVVVALGTAGALVAGALVAVASARVKLGAYDTASAVAAALTIAGVALALVTIVAVAAPERER
jgi:PAP2 superfamily